MNLGGRFASDFPVDVILRDINDEDSGLRAVVIRRTMSFAAYVGVQAEHTLFGLDELTFPCHWSVTLRDWGGGGLSPLPKEWFWWGWDYAHANDMVEYYFGEEESLSEETRELRENLTSLMAGPSLFPRKRWTIGEVEEQALDVMMHLKDALASSEKYAFLLNCR